MRILKNQTKQGSSGSSQTGDAGKKTKQLSKQSSLESKESGSLQDGVSSVDGVLLLQPLEELPEVDDVCVYEMQEGFSDDIGNLLIAPYIQSQSAKQKKHNEDRIVSGVHCVWENLAKEVKIPFSVFGICDGHGGKQASTIASERLVFHVQQYLKNLPISDVLSSDDENTDIEGLDTDIDQILQDLFSQEQASGCEDEEESTKLSEVQIRKQWKIEDEMMRVLPSVLHTAFVNVDKECKEQCQQSGTTATLLVMVGWQVVVASVGDSYCYMDTGKSIKLISSNHRVEDNQQEREAVLARGGKIAKEAMDDGSPVGPLRVWPGGLQMSRSLGDKRSESVISPVPDIKLTTIPVHGARFVLASDGLWDAFKSNPKSALQQIRGSAAGASAPKLLVSAVKKNGLKDDVSILVVDATKEEKGVVGSGDSDFVETSVLDVPKDGGQDAQWKMQRQRIYQVRKQLLQILVQQQKSKAAWETVAKQVDESKEVKSGEQEEQGEQSSSMVNQDLYNLKIDVETLQEGLSKVEIGHNEDEDDEGGEWQTTKKAPKPPGRRSTRNVYTRGRYPPNPNRNTRNTRSVSVRGQYQQSPQQVRRSSSGTLPWPNPRLPVMMLECEHGKDQKASADGQGLSYINSEEAKLVMKVLWTVTQGSTGVQDVVLLTPYKGQVRLLEQLRRAIQEYLPMDVNVSVSSVDGYQGREAEVVIFSTVRANKQNTVGFLRDPRRLNVAITRARSGLVVVGSPQTLKSSNDWYNWLQWIKANKAFQYETAFPVAPWEEESEGVNIHEMIAEVELEEETEDFIINVDDSDSEDNGVEEIRNKKSLHSSPRKVTLQYSKQTPSASKHHKATTIKANSHTSTTSELENLRYDSLQDSQQKDNTAQNGQPIMQGSGDSTKQDYQKNEDNIQVPKAILSQEELQKLTVEKLKKLCQSSQQLEIKGISKMKKQQLISEILKYQNKIDESILISMQ
eukprot:TRINITY_DN11411_c0_g1_i7.p2 TRINITY_DN11411_c0_g1~~TRINITY_DN11411_c0_g1_i7.p2  ORF type:complete len:965 (-),score=168.61 TRINITY_DN11411_c0_g1_i7:3538-6432(-)